MSMKENPTNIMFAVKGKSGDAQSTLATPRSNNRVDITETISNRYVDPQLFLAFIDLIFKVDDPRERIHRPELFLSEEVPLLMLESMTDEYQIKFIISAAKVNVERKRSSLARYSRKVRS